MDESIPEPPGWPVLGHVSHLQPDAPTRSIGHLADKYGPILRLNIVGQPIVVVSSYDLVHEVCDEKRFGKVIAPVLRQVRNGVHNGLFTADNDDPQWGLAHRILMPAFGPMPIKSMFSGMHDIASQLTLKWARQGSAKPINVSDDFTRLALDTIALCTMDYRFNSFYRDEMHPFVQAMGDYLKESGERARRVLPAIFHRAADKKYWDDIEILRQTSDSVLRARKEKPTDHKDLMSAMLESVDPKTGQKLSDSAITDNLITFLIAGHETTSGLLSFSFYQLLKNPDAYRRAQQEVDDIVGSGPVKFEHLPKLGYIAAVLRESLRLNATIPLFFVGAKEDTLLGGRYRVRKDEPILVLLARSHLDPSVFGDDALEFKPERMTDENFDRLSKEFPDSWKPFGNGARGCIGRPFAWQEVLLVMAMLLQNFNFIMDDPSYQLQIKETLTIKPANFNMRAVLREGLTPTLLEHRLSGGSSTGQAPAAPKDSKRPVKANGPKGKPMSIFYGSNSGTCEALARRLASDATAHGFSAAVVEPLDAAQKLPEDHPVVIITASYEGEAPDNAAHFVSWIKTLQNHDANNVPYAVFGCGHHDWAQTFHRIPKLIDSSLEKAGGTRIAPLGLTDVAGGDAFTDFETWEDDILWPALIERYEVDVAELDDVGALTSLTVEVSTPRSSTLRQDVKQALVIVNKTLTNDGTRHTKHIEIKLPSDMRYTAGDYLAILPLNPRESVHRAMRRLQLPWDAYLTIKADGRTTLPTEGSVPASDVLGAYVELAQTATKRSINVLAEATPDKQTKTQLVALASDTYAAEISAKRVSILDLLERFPSIALPLGTFLSLLPPMRVRQYSISSSPLWNPTHATLTYSPLSTPSLSGQGIHHGVASTYLSALAAGDKLHVAVRPSHASFHPPLDASHIPLILVAAGTGVAPFRAFIQERAAMLGAGRDLAPAVLFLGCRAPGKESEPYGEELRAWEKAGAVKVRWAYSRVEGEKEYVQDRLWKDRQEVMELWDQGARLFVCGSRGLGEGVKKTMIRIWEEGAKERGEVSQEGAAEKWFESVRNVRYATDVFD